jgi:gluconate 2-dehydrogenase gamma chain
MTDAQNKIGARETVQDPTRRNFLLTGAAVTAVALELGAPADAQPTASSVQPTPVDASQQGQAPKASAPDQQGFRFLSNTEVETITAIVHRLIPEDEVGPGGVKAGVVTFIDRELAGQFGAAARWYMAGPWAEGTSSQGWQLSVSPAQLYRSSFLALDRWCVGVRGNRFADLTPTDQDQVLTLMETGKIELDGVSSAIFFQMLWQNTVEGYLSDPLYGGNRDMASWRMINFPGANPVLTAAVDLNGELFEIDPIGIGA